MFENCTTVQEVEARYHAERTKIRTNSTYSIDDLKELNKRRIEAMENLKQVKISKFPDTPIIFVQNEPSSMFNIKKGDDVNFFEITKSGEVIFLL